MLALQVEARYCNFFGLVHEYRISVLDELNGDFPVDGVPPDQIYMHFFPGSRVNIEWRKAQVSIAAAYCQGCCTLLHYAQPAILKAKQAELLLVKIQQSSCQQHGCVV